jgi:hypothetical protein
VTLAVAAEAATEATKQEIDGDNDENKSKRKSSIETARPGLARDDNTFDSENVSATDRPALAHQNAATGP